MYRSPLRLLMVLIKYNSCLNLITFFNVAVALVRLSLCLIKQRKFSDALRRLLKSRDILTVIAPMSKLMADGEYIHSRHFMSVHASRAFFS